MGINIAQYRLAIGMFNFVKIKLVLVQFPILYICNVSLQCLIVLYFIQKLLCAGDIEINPGPSKLRFIRICHINIRSLCKDKMWALKIISNQYDIITLSETHLEPTINYDHLKLDGFHDILRRDRKKGGGGVAVYIRDCIVF